MKLASILCKAPIDRARGETSSAVPDRILANIKLFKIGAEQYTRRVVELFYYYQTDKECI